MHINEVFFLIDAGWLRHLRCVQAALDHARSSVDEIGLGPASQPREFESIDGDQFHVPSRYNESEASLGGFERAVVAGRSESVAGELRESTGNIGQEDQEPAGFGVHEEHTYSNAYQNSGSNTARY